MKTDGRDGWYSQRDVSSTFVKGLSVLSAFHDARESLSMPKIGEITGLDRAAVRRLVATLAELGYVEKTGRTYALTPRVLALAGGYLRSHRIGVVVQPVLNRFSFEMGVAISLAAADGDAAIYVAQSSLRESAISFGFTIGSRLPLLHTAIGRMLLAYGDPDWARGQTETAGVSRYTQASLMDRGDIANEIAIARERGYAFVKGEFEAGVAGLAVPVGSPGSARAVVGISVPMDELSDAGNLEKCVIALQQCANEIDRTKAVSAT